jgi:hypothetical protein
MKQLKYNSTNTLRIDYPVEWKTVDLTGVNVSVKNTDGVELLASSAVTLYTTTSLDGEVSRYSDFIILDAGAGDLEPGDSILISGLACSEVATVKGYDTTTKKATLTKILDNEYEDGASVYGQFGTYDLDMSDTDSFKLGLTLQIIWEPVGTSQKTKELYEVSIAKMDLVNLRSRFENRYPRAYRAFTTPNDIFADIANEAEEEVKFELLSEGLVYDRIVGQGLTILVIMAKMACMWTDNGDDEIEDEREHLKDKYAGLFARMLKLPIWQDTDQDDVKDEHEVDTHEPQFERNW